ncbi:hypothetical protein HK405_010120, partial [Cladochytrium tenue]
RRKDVRNRIISLLDVCDVTDSKGRPFTVLVFPAVTPLTEAWFSPNEAQRLSAQLVETVAYMHSHRYAHCDLKPSNLGMDMTTRNLCVLDLGQSACFLAGQEPTVGHVGTKAFLPPEVTHPDNADKRWNAFELDEYALKLTLDAIRSRIDT